jgi:hypothetical protein
VWSLDDQSAGMCVVQRLAEKAGVVGGVLLAGAVRCVKAAKHLPVQRPASACVTNDLRSYACTQHLLRDVREAWMHLLASEYCMCTICCCCTSSTGGRMSRRGSGSPLVVCYPGAALCSALAWQQLRRRSPTAAGCCELLVGLHALNNGCLCCLA